MGLITKTIVGLGLLGTGLAVGHYYGAQSKAVSSEQSISSIEQLPVPRNVIGPQEITLDYVVSQSFTGLLLTDKQNSHQGFLYRAPLVARSGSRLLYMELDTPLSDSAKVQHLYGYAAGEKKDEKYEMGTGIVSLFRKVDQFIYEKTK